MIDTAFVAMMARYNRWQNGSLYGAADTLGDAARRTDRGAFFGSIHGTLNHILWADRMWMSRFWPGKVDKPAVGIGESSLMFDDWAELRAAREAFDARILEWADRVDADWLSGELTWFSGAIGKEVTQPTAGCVVHAFNHQTHHRGQVHAMLTAAGAKPDDTDLFLMPDEDR